MTSKKLYKRVQTEEWYAVILSFFYYFCILAAYYVIRPIRDQLAVEVGSPQLLRFFAATFTATLILTPMFAWLVSYWPRRVIMPFVYLFFIVCQLIFILLFYHQSLLSRQTLGTLFFVWVSLFNLFIVSVFWSFMADIWSDTQARRLFPIIALGGTAGAVIGPMITRSLVEFIELTSLLMISVALLIAAIICIVFLGKWARQFGVHRNEANHGEAIGGGMLDGLKQIFTNSFIGSMSLMMLFNDAIGTIAYSLIIDYSGGAFPNNVIEQTRFAANLDFWTNMMQVIIQTTLTRWLLVHYGAGWVFAIWASIIVFACLTMGLSNDAYTPILGSMPPIALVLIITRSLSYGMIQPARETLYTLVHRSLRYKGKNAVDTTVWRAGDVVSLLSVNGLRTLGLNVAGFAMIWAVLAAISGLIGWRLANGVKKGNFKN